MLRTGSRQLLKQTALLRAAPRIGVRYQSTGPPRRSIKNGLARWALAIGGTYWYMTSPIFNESPAYTIQGDAEGSEAKVQTIDAVKKASRFKPPHAEDPPVVPSSPTSLSPPSINPKSDDPARADTDAVDAAAAVALEEEAAQQGAFNEETGEINWDCPCLGGMAYGPCGTQFRDAFSCFVFSKADPKGMDCIDKFELMQNCFREHPEIYASEIADDERVAEELEAESGQTSAGAAPKDYPDVDQPSVWTPVSESGNEPATTPAAPTETNSKA